MVDQNGDDHMKNYEASRLLPFSKAQNGCYSIGDIREAYYAWASAVPGKRTLEWEEYCDKRDGYAEGTNTKMRRQFEEKQRFGNNERRYIVK